VSALQGSFDLLVALVIGGRSAAALLIGVHQVRAGELSLGSLLARAGVPEGHLQAAQDVEQEDRRARVVDGERRARLCAARQDAGSRRKGKIAHRVGRSTGSLLFLDVSFAYDADPRCCTACRSQRRPARASASAETTGAGKSSLMSLLMRFYDPTDGQILLDGVDLRDLPT